ncbi:Diuretic hormone class 2 [Acromyrmex echinatior]|uniref:Diuretic hormone class 2 n=1 Tax=Acromyrmex echinatior TaxID=103372 RepID=F4WGA3_ACREC|nr:Diuretic hormone class 2 [Acromyrmex echinatior]
MYIISGSKATRVREEEPKEEVAGKRNIRERVKARNALPQNNRRGVSLPTVTRHHAFREFSHPAHCAKRHTVARPRRSGPLNYLRKAHNIACEKELIMSSYNEIHFTCLIGAFPANRQVIYQGATFHAKVFKAKHLWNTPIPRNPSDNLVVGTSRRDTNSPQIVGGRSYLGNKRRECCDREYQPSLDDTPPSPKILRQARFCQLPLAFISDKMQPKMTALCTLLMFVVVIAVSSLTADAIPRNKRGLDLGLNRGYSGSQAAKHMMGLAAANYAGGPGRRRRSEQA